MEGGQIAFAAIVITLFAIGVIVAVAFHHKAERERREAMRALAAQMGFAFTERDPVLDQRFRGFRDFGRGIRARACISSRGRPGSAACACAC